MNTEITTIQQFTTDTKYSTKFLHKIAKWQTQNI